MSTNDGANGGYGRPPKDGRFKPGCSGNPSGRPKGARNLTTDLENILKKRVEIREDGKPRYASSLEAIALNRSLQSARIILTAATQLTNLSTQPRNTAMSVKADHPMPQMLWQPPCLSIFLMPRSHHLAARRASDR